MTTEEYHEELIRQVREVGESLVKNAKGYVGDDKFLTGMEIHVVFDLENAWPEITLTRRSVPEASVKRYD